MATISKMEIMEYNGNYYQVKRDYPSLVVAYLLDNNWDKIISHKWGSQENPYVDMEWKPWYEKRIIMKKNIKND